MSIPPHRSLLQLDHLLILLDNTFLLRSLSVYPQSMGPVVHFQLRLLILICIHKIQVNCHQVFHCQYLWETGQQAEKMPNWNN
jgi:hypothetical protein